MLVLLPAIQTKSESSDFWSFLGIALLVLGLLIRAALYFPLAMFQIDSDAVIAGLCAFRVAAGHYPVFLPGGTRIGAASCYVAAGYFHLFGPGRIGLALTGLTWGALYLAFTLLLLRATLGPKTACLAFLFAIVPAEQFMTVTYAPWGYGEIMASCAATLWLAALWRNEGRIWQRLCFGFSVGVGLWFSLQTLMITLPAIAWIALKRHRIIVAESLPALAAAVAGMTPFFIGNVASGFPTLTQNAYSRAVLSLPQVIDNLFWLLTYLIPKLLLGDLSGWWSGGTILAIAYGLVAVGFYLALSFATPNSARRRTLYDIGELLALVLAACVLIFSFSEAGTIRGWTVRYIAPLYVVVPLFCGIGIAYLWRWSRWLAIVTVAALMIPNLLSYGLPGSGLRSELTSQFTHYVELQKLLAQRNVRAVYGNYLWVYHLNFDSDERIAGVPTNPAYDYYDYGGQLDDSAVRWALLGNSAEVSAWARALGGRGALMENGGLWLFIADRPTLRAAHLLRTLRAMAP